MKKSLLILLSVTSMTLFGCQSTIDNLEISLNKHTLELAVNESETLTTTIKPADLEEPHLVWTNSDSSVATIDEGTLTALKKGTATISVYIDLNNNMTFDIGEPSDECILTVIEPPLEYIPVSSVTLDQTNLSLKINEKRLLDASVLPVNASENTLTWQSSDSLFVAINQGEITALLPGTATITAYVDENRNGEQDGNEKGAACEITVLEENTDPTIWVTGITLNKTTVALEVDQYEIINATVMPIDATIKIVTWLTSNASVATVDNGRIDALKEGSATVTAFVDENRNGQFDANEKGSVVALSVTEKTNSSGPGADPIPASGESLPIGNTTVSGPSNTTPVDITEWTSYDFFSSLPNYWSFITGNNKKTTSGDFYAESSGGGFKFSQPYYGLQSPLLNSWLKTEVRLKVSQVNNNSQSQSQYEGKPIFHIYSYDKTGHYIGMQTYEQQSKFASVTNITFYIANPNMAYFEIRLNAFPYKGSQCYNFGVSEIRLKGWPYGL